MSQDILERLQAWLSQETVETDPAAVVREAAKEIKRLRDQWEIRGHVMDSIADLLVKPRWIPVGERLPEDGQSVIACFASGGINRQVGEATFDKRNKWFSTDYGAWDASHWMPLPEPPQERRDGNS